MEESTGLLLWKSIWKVARRSGRSKSQKNQNIYAVLFQKNRRILIKFYAPQGKWRATSFKILTTKPSMITTKRHSWNVQIVPVRSSLIDSKSIWEVVKDQGLLQCRIEKLGLPLSTKLLFRQNLLPDLRHCSAIFGTFGVILSGREYGTASLNIHLKSCKDKWEIAEAKKPKHLRRPLPQEPQNFDEIVTKADKMSMNQLQNFNNAAFNDYNEKALVKCPNCPRTFLPDRLEIHLRSCRGPGMQAASASPVPHSKRLTSPKPVARPKTLICYLW